MDNFSTPTEVQAQPPSPIDYDELVAHPDALVRRRVVFDPAVDDELLSRLRHDPDPLVMSIALVRLGEIRALAPSASQVTMLAGREVEDPALVGLDLTELEAEYKHARMKLEGTKLLIETDPSSETARVTLERLAFDLRWRIASIERAIEQTLMTLQKVGLSAPAVHATGLPNRNPLDTSQHPAIGAARVSAGAASGSEPRACG